MKINKLILLFFSASILLSACNSDKIKLEDANTWNKQQYSKAEDIMKKDLQEFFNKNLSNTAPNSIITGNIEQIIATPTDTNGNYKVVAYVSIFKRYDASAIKNLDANYEEANKYFKGVAEEAQKKGKPIVFDVHYPFKEGTVIYTYFYSKSNELIKTESY